MHFLQNAIKKDPLTATKGLRLQRSFTFLHENDPKHTTLLTSFSFMRLSPHQGDIMKIS
uniref:Uncharacterized protein n=1 Tax=Poecilia reticulata TaxID=8081 RepID=A0A3P9QHJ9_POERE